MCFAGLVNGEAEADKKEIVDIKHMPY